MGSTIMKVLFDKPKNTGFRFGFIAMLLVSIAFIYPSFYQIGYSNPALLSFTVMMLIGLMMSIMFGYTLKNKTSSGVDTQMTGIAITRQMQVLIVGVVAGLVLVVVNVVTGMGISFVADISYTEQLLFFGLLAGVSEELFFRGFIQNMLRVYVPSMIFAIVPSAFIFAMFHYFAYGLSITALGVMFALGLFLGLLHELFNDIGVPMIAHVVNNIFSMLPFVIAMIFGNLILIVVLFFVIVGSYLLTSQRRSG